MSAIDLAANALLAIEDHRADCPKCRPAADVFLRSQKLFEDQVKLVAQVCPQGRKLWARYWRLGQQALDEHSPS